MRPSVPGTLHGKAESFGIAMGGEWGLGSSLAMESLPTESRGLFSGILQRGIIPVHLNELSPTDVRGTFPGFAYQLGNLFAASIVTIEAIVADNLGTIKAPDYAAALAIFSLGAFLAVILFTAIGREARGIEFITSDEEEMRTEVAAERVGRRLA